VRNELRSATDIIPRQHYSGGSDIRVQQKDALDLLELDPVAADLHLMVDAPDKLKDAISTPAG
jgi:hypothetical protein